MSKRPVSSIDIAKFFFSICIVVLHSDVYRGLPGLLPSLAEKLILRLAVPFFFIVSGYFLGVKLKSGNVEACIRQYVARLLPPFLVFGAINTVLEMIKMYQSGSGHIAVTVIQHLLFYPYGALWYVSASMLGACLLIPFLKRNRLNLALAVGGVLYCWALLCNNYYFLTTPIRWIVDTYLRIFISARNGVFVGFFMLAIGIKLSTIDIPAVKVKGWTVLFFLLYVAEICVVRTFPSADDAALYVMLPVFVACFVITLLQMPLSLPERVSRLLRSLSTGIYFQHRMWLSVIALLSITQNRAIAAGLTIAVSILCCVAAQHALGKGKSKLPRNL